MAPEFALTVRPGDWRALLPALAASLAHVPLQLSPPQDAAGGAKDKAKTPSPGLDREETIEAELFGAAGKSDASGKSPPAGKSDASGKPPAAGNSDGSRRSGVPGPFVLSTGDDGPKVFEPTAAAVYLVEASSGPQDLLGVDPAGRAEVLSWLDWEATVLRPAVLQYALATASEDAPASTALDVALKKVESGVARYGTLVGKSRTLADAAVWASLLALFYVAPHRSLCEPLSVWVRALGERSEFKAAVAQALGSEDPRACVLAAAQSLPGASTELAAKPILPQPGKRNILVTSALPYVNNVPHLGNIIGCVLSADVYARFCRIRGYNVIFICGTDEYGTATETKAMEEKLTPREICDKYHAIHRDIYSWFGISFDKFGRTSTPQQTQICQSIFNTLLAKGRLLQDSMSQPYCTTCSRFLADRFVEGICPTSGCGYEDARGDQCDKCGKLLNAADLIKPRCHICGNPPEIRSTEHLFLDLPGLKERLEEYVSSTSVEGGWSSNSVQTTGAWIRDGLKPRCITRDLKWGVPVPLEKYHDKVFYVWFDAPIGYISITANYTDQWRQWWQSPRDVELVQFMGKDNVPFHTVIFPCTLLGTEQPWTLMRTISVTEYLNYEDGKFSKSRGVGVFGNDARDTGIPPEIWRYYLLTNRPEASDTVFTWSDLQAKQNNELLKNLGNFINRTLAFLAKPEGEGYGSVVPEALHPEEDELTSKLSKDVGQQLVEYVDNMEKVKLKAGLKTAMAISSLGNLYLQDSKFWKLFKEDGARCDAVIRTSVGLVHLLATLLQPFMPTFADKVLAQLNMPASSLTLADVPADTAAAYVCQVWERVGAGHRIGAVEPIFREMKDDEVEAFRVRFSGTQADRKAPAAAPSGDAAAAAGDKGKGEAGKGAKKGDGKGDKGKGDGAGKGGKKEKGGGAESSGKGKEAEKENTATDVSRLDIRVGVITKVDRHPDADSLYVEEIDLGEPTGPRTVVSGLVKFVPIEEMQNRKVCVLCNLKPAAMRGVKSHAMVLAASNSDHTKVELLTPPAESPPGARITAEGFPGEPDAQLNPKKKIWEAVQVDLRTNGDCVACFKGVPLQTSHGICRVASLIDASIG